VPYWKASCFHRCAFVRNGMILPMHRVGKCVDTRASLKNFCSSVSSLWRFLATQSANHVTQIESCRNACLWTESSGILRGQMCNLRKRNASNRVACKEAKIQSSKVLSLGSVWDPHVPLMHGQGLLKWANRGNLYGI